MLLYRLLTALAEPESGLGLGKRLALLAGGRSGGHVFPAVAVAEELSARGWLIAMVGTSDGLERRVAEERGLPFHALEARPLVGGGLWSKIRSVATLSRSAVRAYSLVRRLEPRAILSTGGYVSAPTVVGGWLARCPVMLLEPNASAGKANRWLSRLARGAAVAYGQTRSELQCPSWVLGVPVRTEFFDQPAEAPAGTLPTLLVLGGSQGAERLNQTVPPAVAEIGQRLGGVRVVHQTGEAHVESTREIYERVLAQANVDRSVTRVEVVPFLADVAAAMGQSHVVVSRAGAITLAEICAAGRASVLVPLRLAGGHQRRNAEVLEQAGAAEALDEEVLTSALLASTLTTLITEPERRRAMARAAKGLARPDARERIADRLEELGGQGAVADSKRHRAQERST